MYLFKLASIIFIILISSNLYADVEIGGVCYGQDQIYHYVTDIEKTPWVIDELYALPVGENSPEAWEYSSAFYQRLLAILDPTRTSEAFAAACGTVWRDFFTDTADVIVSIRRTITSTVNVLQCLSGNWVLISVNTLEMPDTSDWLMLRDEPFHVTDESSVLLLHELLQDRLNNVNAQPGAASYHENAQ